MQIQDIMVHVVEYANLATDCRYAIEAGKIDELKKLEFKKESMFNEIMTLIKMSQQDAVISELKMAISTLSHKEQANGN